MTPNRRVSRLKFLMLDDRNIHKLANARVLVNQPTCHPANPIFSSEKGLWDISKGQNGGAQNVMWDQEDRLFKAWYVFGVAQVFHSKPVKEYSHLAYATSQDGIHWDRPNLGQVEFEGSRQNNILDVPYTGCVIFTDPSEVIAERRFKMVFTATDTTPAGMFCPICIAYSPDGLHWTVPRLRYSRRPDPAINHPVNPVIPEGTDAVSAFSWYWDPYIRRYVGLMRPLWNSPRRICMSESDDFVHWTPRQIILEPDEHDPLHDQDFHGMHVMFYEGYRIGFMQIYHNLHEGWYAYHEIPDDAPRWTETFSLQLTYSRDGRNWLRCGGRQEFLSPSEPGGNLFDASMVSAVNRPFVHKDKIWIYYRGSPDRHTYPEHQRKGLGRATGLAQLRLDGFASVDADKEGTCITDRLNIIPTYVKVNASAKGGSIRTEALDPFCQPIPQFTVDQAIPFKGDDLAGPITWKDDRRLSDITNQLLGGIRLKFYIERAKLYSFTLEREED